MLHLRYVDIFCFGWKLWLSTENVLMAGLQRLTKVGILYRKQTIQFSIEVNPPFYHRGNNKWF